VIDISGQQFELDKSLAAFPSDLHGEPRVFRDNCSARSGGSRSTLVARGRGGLSQDPDAAIPALYLAERPLTPLAGGGEIVPPLQINVAALLPATSCR
jgi:hypothetical protein